MTTPVLSITYEDCNGVTTRFGQNILADDDIDALLTSFCGFLRAVGYAEKTVDDAIEDAAVIIAEKKGEVITWKKQEELQDDFGDERDGVNTCLKCGRRIHMVSPGKWQCERCE